MSYKANRQPSLTLVFVLTGVLPFLGVDVLDAKKGGKTPAWEWSVDIAEMEDPANSVNLYGDGSTYTDSGSVYVRVIKESKRAYRFRLRIHNGSGHSVELRNVELSSAAIDYDDGPGYFPTPDCAVPTPVFCNSEDSCSERFGDFLNRVHPICDYDYVDLNITVALDIEGMEVGEKRFLSGDIVGFYIHMSSDILRDPTEQFPQYGRPYPPNRSRTGQPLQPTLDKKNRR
jgi:hypothetical protein